MALISSTGNHYVIQVKTNAKTLYQAIQQAQATESPLDSYTMVDRQHGRTTNWQIKVYGVNQAVLRKKWQNLHRFIIIEKTSTTRRRGLNPVISRCCSYRISDLVTRTAEALLVGIRGHWGIENRVHWVKDVILQEGKNQIKHPTGAVLMAVSTTIALNFLRKHVHDSIKYAQIIFGQNIKEHLSYMRT
ncbi:MAG: ISAs1 family transposase [Cytophagaceae bacterium]|nr:ISAs1 family transposase [Cytophagaceae bacterium]